MKQYRNLSELPAKLGKYVVDAEFADGFETVVVELVKDFDDDGNVVEGSYGYRVADLDDVNCYDLCMGFDTLQDAVNAIEPRLKKIK